MFQLRNDERVFSFMKTFPELKTGKSAEHRNIIAVEVQVKSHQDPPALIKPFIQFTNPAASARFFSVRCTGCTLIEREILCLFFSSRVIFNVINRIPTLAKHAFRLSMRSFLEENINEFSVKCSSSSRVVDNGATREREMNWFSGKSSVT